MSRLHMLRVFSTDPHHQDTVQHTHTKPVETAQLSNCGSPRLWSYSPTNVLNVEVSPTHMVVFLTRDETGFSRLPNQNYNSVTVTVLYLICWMDALPFFFLADTA